MRAWVDMKKIGPSHSGPMLFETVPEREDTKAAAHRSVRRTLELGMLGVVDAMVAVLLVLPPRLGELTEQAHAILYGTTAVMTVLFLGPMIFCWNAPPNSLVESTAKNFAALRAANQPLRVISRQGIALLGAFGLACSVLAAWLMPV